MKNRTGSHITLYKCENCGHPIYSVRAAENIEQYGCPVCGKKVLEAVSTVDEAALVLPPHEITQLQAHIARREAR